MKFPFYSSYTQVCRTLAVLLYLLLFSTSALAKDGSDVYEAICQKCHSPIIEKTGWYDFLPDDGSAVLLAVVTPRGPTLNDIVGRPAAIISNYQYSKGMRKFAETGAIWNRETLEQFLTDSRKFVKGTFMIMKMAEEDRKLVLDYLESVAIYSP